jgi:hypothetical protein
MAIKLCAANALRTMPATGWPHDANAQTPQLRPNTSKLPKMVNFSFIILAACARRICASSYYFDSKTGPARRPIRFLTFRHELP